MKRLYVLGERCLEVAPHAGAWIETLCMPLDSPIRHVAPHAGAWIETDATWTNSDPTTSPLMRGRGLKPDKAKNRKTLDGRPSCGGVD